MKHRKKDIVCQGTLGHKMRGVVLMLVVGCELCLLRIEVLHIGGGWLIA